MYLKNVELKRSKIGEDLVNQKQRFDNKLIYVNFILACSIVILHTINNSPKFISQVTAINYFFDFVVELCNITVPCFFAVSGFLFYYNFKWEKLLGKWKRRFFSLVIPFFIWNTIIYFYYYGISRVSMFEMEPIIFSFKNYLISIFNSINSPLWFIRTLVVYVVVSPACILLWRKKWIAQIMIVALIASNYMGISTRFISNYYLPMYLLGAYMALYHDDIIIGINDKNGKWKKSFGIVGMCIVSVLALAITPLQLNDLWLYTLRLTGVLSFWFAFDVFKFDKPPKPYFSNSFSIYLIHCILVKTIKLIFYYMLPHSTALLILEYFLSPAVVISLILLLSEGFKKNKYTCKIWSVMLGNR